MSSPRLDDDDHYQQGTKYHDLDSLPSPTRFQQASSKAKRIGQNVSEKAKALQQRSGFYNNPDSAQASLLQEASEEMSEPEVETTGECTGILRRSKEFFGKLSGERGTGAATTKPVKMKP